METDAEFFDQDPEEDRMDKNDLFGEGKKFRFYKRNPLLFGPEAKLKIIKFPRGMFNTNDKLELIGAELAKGKNNAQTCERLGVAPETVAKLRRVLNVEFQKTFLCGCGLPSDHNGQCGDRFSKLPATSKAKLISSRLKSGWSGKIGIRRLATPSKRIGVNKLQPKLKTKKTWMLIFLKAHENHK